MNKKGLFGIVNSGSGDGLGLTKVIPGTTLGSAVAVTAAMPAFVNSSGVLVFPQLNASGQIQVSSEQVGDCAYAAGSLTGSTSFQDVASFTGALSKVYNAFEFSVNSATECDWELVYVDDAAGTPVETILGYADTGPGQYSYSWDMHCVEIDTTGGTGVQKFLIRGKLYEATGSLIQATMALNNISP